ncbi:hypothetical protein GOBAR_AA39055 [Gossypium barbadense]|uniref:Uncharacterized protein n=1 Tax=Gossypium barbadense TaxID=3634 RepID=A0A2P5QRL0_GOSBA|nr:hypothetical protein GOBAR_DD25909 [Gossypium barbadense]PPR81663.1 hypothetical protein GOBAR_AA39055 [Gossypium barbadense]
MFKKTSSRNQRSKGIRIKHVLQICLLLGVCFWLIYQVKRSHDKRKEFDAKDAKVSVKEQADDLILKFGRKDLPHVQEASKNFKHEEEEEENVMEDENKHDEEQEEKTKRLEEEEHEGAIKHEEEERVEGIKREEEEQEEGSKHEEEEEEETNKHEEEEEAEEVRSKHEDEEQEAEIKDEEAEDEGKVVGDDEVDENEQERADAEVENEELANDQNADGGDRDTHEAREEQYKGDDASSAVSHDTQITTSETDKLEMENPNDNLTTNVLEQESKANATEKTGGDENKSEGKQSEGGSSSTGDENKSDLKADEGKHSETGSSLNMTDSKENDHDTGSSNSEHISPQNTTDTTELIVQASNNSTEESKETNNEAAKEIPGSLQNGTSALDTTGGGRVIEEIYKEKANETVVDASKIENVVNVTTEGKGFESSTTKETTDNEKQGDNESNGKDENEDTSSSNETVDGNHNDPIDTSDNSVSQEEKGTEIDLSTLPDTTMEGAANEDSVAE